jgi:hypothetical protein
MDCHTTVERKQSTTKKHLLGEHEPGQAFAVHALSLIAYSKKYHTLALCPEAKQKVMLQHVLCLCANRKHMEQGKP